MNEIGESGDLDSNSFYDKPTGERGQPVGANDTDDETAICLEKPTSVEDSKLRYLEEQHEILNSSLIALTSHFAQVQFRLKQIVDAPLCEKEKLLKDLESFAFRGIPEIQDGQFSQYVHPSLYIDEAFEEKISAQRAKQKELITQLKTQLEELEKYAYETGEADLPQSMVLERQKAILDQFKRKLNLNVDDMVKLTTDDLRVEVDSAINQIVNPWKMKEHLVMQLKTQISDLERFIQFLQEGESTAESKIKLKKKVCTCDCHSSNYSAWTQQFPRKDGSDEKMHEDTINIMRKVATLLQMFVITQLGCGTEKFKKNKLKRSRINHWGDARARLETAVNYVVELITHPKRDWVNTDYTSDSEETSLSSCNSQLLAAIRKDLALSIRDLIQHGLMPVGQSSSVVEFVGCFPQPQYSSGRSMHAWELILKYYEIKNGDKFNMTPARKLSQSFNLNIVGGSAVTYKQTLLSVIGSILATHSRYKRGFDSQFKAFICAALNHKMLVVWLRMILKCQHLMELYFQPWSYAANTGFEDSFQCLEKLSNYSFDLPIDLAVRQFQNIRDAF